MQKTTNDFLQSLVKFSSIFCTAALLSACANGSSTRSMQAQHAERVCAPSETARPLPARFAIQPNQAAEARLEALGFSASAIAAAHAIGATDEVYRIATRPAQQRHDMSALTLRLRISDRILLGTIDSSSIAGEIICEGERGDALRLSMKSYLDNRSQKANLASILVGAGTAAVSGGLAWGSLDVAANAVGTGGGLIEAGLGAFMLFDDTDSDFRTPRNLLAEVWAKPQEPTYFPRSVWRYLTRPGPDGASHLDTMVASWRTPSLLGEPDSDEEKERIALLFGDGGKYAIDTLIIRDEMLDQLRSVVLLINRDLRMLARELGELPGM